MILLTTGAFVSYPGFRTAVIGGSGQLLSDIHFFTGLAFILILPLHLWMARRSIVRTGKLWMGLKRKPAWRDCQDGGVA